MEARYIQDVQEPTQQVVDTPESLHWSPYQQPKLDEAIRNTNWDRLRQLASNLNDGMPCKLLDKTNAGLNNLVRVLEFADTTRWVVRIPLHLGKRALDSTKLQSEVHTMQLIQERCPRNKLPVPRVFAFKADTDNDVGVPFVLMEFILANTAMDSNGGYDVHRGVIPKELRPKFYRSMAQCHTHLARLRFPKIGTIVRCEKTGAFDVGPLPHLGGPFETASAYFAAWAAHVQFSMDRDEIFRSMPASLGPELARQVADAVESFPTQVSDLLAGRRRASPRDEGPFPLAHADFLHSNVLVDAEFGVVGVIDWEGAHTVPWECVAFPGFLECMPPSFDMPTKYDDDGQPLDEETRALWGERRQYVQLVRAEERDAAAEEGWEEPDDLLSSTLGDDNAQALAYAIKVYEDVGKLGFYDRVIRQVWSSCDS